MATLPPSIAELAAWGGVEADSLDDARAGAVLSAATSLVRGYSGKAWEDDDVPDEVASIVVQMTTRVYLSPANPNVRQWAKGPFSEGYFDASTNGLYLTDEEKSVLNRYRAAVSGLGTVTTTRGEASLSTVFVPTGPPPSGYDFPWYAADGY